MTLLSLCNETRMDSLLAERGEDLVVGVERHLLVAAAARHVEREPLLEVRAQLVLGLPVLHPEPEHYSTFRLQRKYFLWDESGWVG